MRLRLPGRARDRVKRGADIQSLMVAAATDNVQAQLALAWHYVRGECVPVDLVTAANWFERAAASGAEEALVQRARFLQLRRVPQGQRDLRRFAAGGNWKAQFWLAQYYESRRHRVGRLRAAVWYERSYANGNLVGRAAKLILLTRLAPLLSKPIFAAAALKEIALLFRRLPAKNPHFDQYEALQYRLKPRDK